MTLKEQIEQFQREDLEDVKKAREELEQGLKLNEEDRNKALTELSTLKEEESERLQKLHDDLSEEGKEVLKLRYKLWKTAQVKGKFAFLISAIYAIVVAGVLYFFNLGFSLTAIAIYIISAILIIPVFLISKKCLEKPWLNKWWATYSNPIVKEYDEKIEEERKNTSDKEKELKLSLKQCDERKEEGNKLLAELNNYEKAKLRYLDEIDYHIAYGNTILFYGENRGNYYDIYIDGRHYDTVRGKTIVTIKLTKGSHYIKFTNTALNFDKSVIYSYSFNTEQLNITDILVAYPVVIDFNSISYPSLKRFEEITKQKLI